MTVPAVSLRSALAFWFRLGFISFGGPAGQIALMHAELVERRRWISERRFLHALNYCMLLPGPEATQLAVYIGWLLHRTPGAIAAGVLFVLPSLLLLIVLSTVYLLYGTVPLIAGLLYGIKPAVVALVLTAAVRIGGRTLHGPLLAAIAAAAFLAIAVANVPFPAIVATAALLGWLGGRVAPAQFSPRATHAAGAGAHAPALIDDDTPTPPHARFSWTRLARTALFGAGLGVAAWAVLAARYGVQGTLTQMAAFFTRAALLTFGGAYAVLPYVYQGAVEHYHWIAAPQMMDGLALGETTPGPLIMIVAFVGFIGSWNAAVFGPGHAIAAGVAGACVVAFFTFLPSFVFILAGGPLVEATRGNLRLTAPLTAISAAVVGVILNLALFFGWHVCRPGGHWDLRAIALAVLACAALLRFRAGAIPVIAACALAGAVLSYLPP
jgi:chromate transporter